MIVRATAQLARRHLAALIIIAVPMALVSAVVVGLPRYLSVEETKALRTELSATDPHVRDLYADATMAVPHPAPVGPDPRLGPALASSGTAFAAQAIPPMFRQLTGPVRYDVTGTPVKVTGPGVAQPDGLPPRVAMFYRSDIDAHIRFTSGRAPADVVSAEDSPKGAAVLDVAISADAAAKLHVQVGTEVEASGARAPLTLRVVGIYVPVNSADRYWDDTPNLTTAVLTRTRPNIDAPWYWLSDVLIGPTELSAATTLYGSLPVRWQYPVAVAGIDIKNYDALRKATSIWNGATMQASFDSTPTLRAPGLAGRTGLTEVLDGFGTDVRNSVLLASLGLGGLLTVLGAIVALAARLLIERQRTTLTLMRSRGGSGRQIGALVGLQVAVVTWPAAVLGGVVAGAVTTGAGSVEPSGLVVGVLIAVGAVPAAVGGWVARLGRVPRAGGRAMWRPPTRLTGEVLLVAVAATAWLELRSRGVNESATGVDPLVSAVPVLIAAVGAAFVLRGYPLTVRAVAWWLSRGRGGVGFMGAAQAQRRQSASAAATPVLLVAVGLAVFGSVLTTTVDRGRELTAWRQVGGEIRIDAVAGVGGASGGAAGSTATGGGSGGGQATNSSGVAAGGAGAGPVNGVDDPEPPLDPAGLARVAGSAEVRSVLTARIEAFAGISGGVANPQVSVFAVDPGADADMLARSPLDDAALEQPLRNLAVAARDFPTQPAGDRVIRTPVPVLVTADLVAEFAGGGVQVTVRNSSFPARVVGVIERIPGQMPSGPVVVVPWAAGATAAGSALVPNVAWVVPKNPADPGQAARLRSSIEHSLPGAAVLSRNMAARDIGATRAAPVAQQLFVASEVGEGVLCVVVVLLAVVLGAPRRGRMLTLLRTLGFTPRQVRVLAVCELLPVVVTVAVAGTGVGLGILPLIRDSIDLVTLTGGDSVGGAVREAVDGTAIAVIAAGLVVVAGVAVGAESAVLRRMGIGRVVRIGGD